MARTVEPRYIQLEDRKVVDFGDQRIVKRARWEKSQDEFGVEQLVAIFPLHNGAKSEQRIDISRLLRFSHLQEAFADGFVAWGTRKRYRTRIEFSRNLTRGWLSFLDSFSDANSLSPDDINGNAFREFADWLNHYVGPKGKRLKSNDKTKRYRVVLNLLDEIRNLPRWQKSQLALVFPKRNPWGRRTLPEQPTATIPYPQLAAILRACTEEIVATKSKLAATKDLIERSRDLVPALPSRQSDYKDLGVCLAAVDASFPGVIPGRYDIRKVNRHLENAILAYHGFSEIPAYFYAQPRMLVPFALLLTIYTAGNEEPILTANIDDFEEAVVLGVDRLIWRGRKERGRRKQIRSFAVDDEPDNPRQVIAVLKDLTIRLRRVAPPHKANKLFLYITKWAGAKEVDSFLDSDKEGSGCAWNHSLKNFIGDHDLPAFTLRMLRMTTIDLANDLFDGDMRAIAAIGGQRAAQTINDHYYSGAARRRNNEMVADVIQLRDRWVATHGIVDCRDMMSTEDPGAATPGWRCLDPFASPIAGQEAGKLCGAFGACPGCPLGHLDTGSGYALARLYQLKTAIEAAQSKISAQRWISTWAPRLLRIINYWLPQFSDSELIEYALNLRLSALPPLE